MKYSNQINSRIRFFVFLILVVILLFLGFLIALWSAFPIRLTSDEMEKNDAWYLNAFTFWPNSPLNEAAFEQKKLKRFSKVEIKKRLDKQLKSMALINTPLYDIWLDKTLETNLHSETNNLSFFWPVLPVHGSINELNAKYVILPQYRNIILKKGIYLGSGGSIKSNIPVSNMKRYAIFEILPLTSGRIKILLGQYVWIKNINPIDVHKSAKFFIPINDSLAQNYRIMNHSSSFYLLDFKIVNVTSNAREPILLSKQSELWKPFSQVKKEIEVINPLTELSNESRFYEKDMFLAKGYNTVLVEINGLKEDVFKDFPTIAKLMPNLNKFYRHSLFINNIVNSSREHLRFQWPAVYKQFGYKTALFTRAIDLNFDDSLTYFKNFDFIANGWLVESDARVFRTKNNSIDKKDQDGLNAVFKPKIQSYSPKIEEQNFRFLESYLSLLAPFSVKKNNFAFDETFLFSEKNYSPVLMQNLKQWTSEQKRNRFFIDVNLDVDKKLSKISLQDLNYGIRKSKNLAWKNIVTTSQIHKLDREIGYLSEALQTSFMTHRTVVVFLFKSPSEEGSKAFMYVPGLTQKNAYNTKKLALNDLLSYIAASVGIPVDMAVNFEKGYTNIENGQEIAFARGQNNRIHHSRVKFKMILAPHKNNCEPFVWRGTSEIFDIKSNLPFYQLNQNSLKFFPCAFNKEILEIEWKQETQQENLMELEPRDHFYGNFVKNRESSFMPEVYFGRKILNFAHFPITFQHTKEQIDSYVLVNLNEIESLSVTAKAAFKTMEADKMLTQNMKVALFISPIMAE